MEDRKFQEEDKLEEPIYSGSYSRLTGTQYCIFRVSNKKYKTISQITHYQNHMERLIDTPNADLSIKNDVLIGSSNIVGDVKEYINGIQIRKNGVIARDLLLTASPGFFKYSTEEEKQRWVNLNVSWLKEHFNDNCVYATLHKDETTWHISALIVPRFYNHKTGKYVLQNYKYFDGIEKLRSWQDNYASAMQGSFKILNRGVRFSKAKHIEVRHYYAMVNSKLNEEDINQICAKAKDRELMAKQIKSIQGTLNAYQEYSKKTEEEKLKLLKSNNLLLSNLDEVQNDKEIYKETLKALSEIYKIPQKSIIKVIKHVEEKLNNDLNKVKVKELDLKLSRKGDQGNG